jgi:nitrile hydratase accessory protein
MIDSTTLAKLPLLPRDEEGPVFTEPWQAQAFATLVKLVDDGQITWEEWAERLGAQFRKSEERCEFDTGQRYYEHWLAALEELIVEKELTGWAELKEERDSIEANDHHRREHQLHHDHDHTH